ncbi:hemolysin XhlA family protein [Alicyclobacillus fodiniaquatilis]|uniref:Hemolysin XhlA family protein n=1 Tax=Alicyclobacillus fodiniaquatilis TaxID=1661150 RepID=A0ABW4JJZ4_9BACL
MGEPIPEWAQDIRERVVRIETMVTDSGNTKDKADAADNRSKENDRRLTKLEDSHTWLWRTVLASLIGAGVAYLFSRIH